MVADPGVVYQTPIKGRLQITHIGTLQDTRFFPDHICLLLLSVEEKILSFYMQASARSTALIQSEFF